MAKEGKKDSADKVKPVSKAVPDSSAKETEADQSSLSSGEESTGGKKVIDTTGENAGAVEDIKETPQQDEAKVIESASDEKVEPSNGEVSIIKEESDKAEISDTDPEEQELFDLDLESQPESKFNKKTALVILVIILLIAGIGVGIYYFFVKDNGESTEEILSKPVNEKVEEDGDKKTDEATDSADAELEDSEANEVLTVDLSKYSLQILNGSGIAGEAGAVKELLEEEGFEDFETDNADSYDYTDTEVSLKKDVPDSVFEAIVKSLEPYPVEKTKKALDENSDYDIVIIVGQKN